MEQAEHEEKPQAKENGKDASSAWETDLIVASTATEQVGSEQAGNRKNKNSYLPNTASFVLYLRDRKPANLLRLKISTPQN